MNETLSSGRDNFPPLTGNKSFSLKKINNFDPLLVREQDFAFFLHKGEQMYRDRIFLCFMHRLQCETKNLENSFDVFG